MRISVGERFFAAVTQVLEQKHGSVATWGQEQAFDVIGSSLDEYR
jgi:hypothetical protein